MIIKQLITIPALSGETPRNSYVYLPVGYYENPQKRYPVLYMFDGHNLFYDQDATYGKSWGLGEYLDYTRTQLIVAAVECNHSGNMRLSEYSPVDFEMNGSQIKGRGKIYMDWLIEEYKPYIDKTFRTLPQREFTSISGSSMGGLMTLYALSEYGNYFASGAALSPSLWINGRTCIPFISSRKFNPDTVLFMSYGGKEFTNHFTQRRAFAQTCSVLIQKGINLTCKITPDGRHSEASWQREIPYFMNVLGYLPEEEL